MSNKITHPPLYYGNTIGGASAARPGAPNRVSMAGQNRRDGAASKEGGQDHEAMDGRGRGQGRRDGPQDSAHRQAAGLAAPARRGATAAAVRGSGPVPSTKIDVEALFAAFDRSPVHNQHLARAALAKFSTDYKG